MVYSNICTQIISEDFKYVAVMLDYTLKNKGSSVFPFSTLSSAKDLTCLSITILEVKVGSSLEKKKCWMLHYGFSRFAYWVLGSLKHHYIDVSLESLKIKYLFVELKKDLL